jgi:hypothetical protein
MIGNVSQWDEGLYGGSFHYRVSRAGYSGGPALFLYPDTRIGFDPTSEVANAGFRVASIPEPSTAVLAMLACGLMWVLRRRFR